MGFINGQVTVYTSIGVGLLNNVHIVNLPKRHQSTVLFLCAQGPSTLASVDSEGVFVLWNLADRTSMWEQRTNVGRPSSMALNGRHLFLGTEGGSLMRIDWTEKRLDFHTQLFPVDSPITGIQLLPECAVVNSYRAKSVALVAYALVSPNQKSVGEIPWLSGNSENITCVRVMDTSPEKFLVAAGDAVGMIQLFCVKKAEFEIESVV